MLIRTLLLALFLISSALSICVAESGTMPTNSSNAVISDRAMTMEKSASATSDTSMTMEEALERVTISTEDWLDGDTYYLRYTFTNPTDVAIDKKVDLTTVKYERCTQNAPFEKQYQCSDSLTHLTIPPYGTYEVTIALPQTSPADFNRLKLSRFYFDDNSSLTYSRILSLMPKPLISVTPIISTDTNSLSLSIHNKSFVTPITKLDNLSIRLRNYCSPDTQIAYSGPISSTVNPRETQNYHISDIAPEFLNHTTQEIKNTTDLYSLFHLPAGLFIQMEMNINDIPYVYSGTLTMEAPFTPIDESFYRFTLETNYIPSPNPPTSMNGSYYLDGSYLNLYLPMYNPTSESIIDSTFQYGMVIKYFDRHHYAQAVYCEITFPEDFSIAPSETQYFSCKIPWPTDVLTLVPHYSICLSPSNGSLPPNLANLTLYPTATPPTSRQYLTLFPSKIIPFHP